MISEGSPQDLLRRICTPGSPQDLRVRSCARSCKDLFCASLISEEPFYAGIYRQNALPQKSAARFARACAVDMAMDTSQEPFYAKILKESQGKDPASGPRQPFCASLRSRNAFGHLRRAVVCVNLQGKCRAPDGAP